MELVTLVEDLIFSRKKDERKAVFENSFQNEKEVLLNF